MTTQRCRQVTASMTRTAGRFCLLQAQPPRLPRVLPLQETFAKLRRRERKDPTASMLKSCSESDAHGVTVVKSRVLGESHSVNTPRQATSTAGSMETFWAALDLHHFTSHRHGRHRLEPHRRDRWRALPRVSTPPSASAGGRERSTRPQRPRPRPAFSPWAGTEPTNQKFLKHANKPPPPGERRFPTLAASFADAATQFCLPPSTALKSVS